MLFLIPSICSAGITYNPSTNTITVVGDATCGNSESNACGFEDIYNADKAGTLVLVDRDGITGTDTDPVSNTYNLRPADEKVMGGAKHDLWLTIENWSGFTNATIRLIGKDEAGNDQTEDIVVTGNGTYYSNELWTELTQTQVIGVSGSGSFDYLLSQGQWGVVSKQNNDQYFFEANLTIGDGSISTYFIDSSKQITFADFNDEYTPDIYITQNAYFRLGIQESEDITHSGCHISSLATAYSHLIIQSEVPIFIYSSSFDVQSDSCDYAFIRIDDETNISEFRNCLFRNKVYIYKGKLLLHNVIIENAHDGLRSKIADADNVILQKGVNGFYFFIHSGTSVVRNVKIQNFTYDFYLYLTSSDNVYAIDTECSWNLCWNWRAQGKLYRQYSFNLKVVDKASNPIRNASVKIWDKNNNLVVNETTDVNGQISEQILTYGYYDKEHENTPIMQTPHTIKIAKAGYQTYEKKFTSDKKIDWMIALATSHETPKITNWYNNHTNDNSTFIHINNSTCIYFNVTTDQSIDNFYWYKNDNFLYHNYDNITVCWNNTEETGILKVWGENSNGTTNTVVWYVGENMSMLNESINLLLEEGEMTGLSLLLGILIIAALVFLLLGVLVPNSVLTLMGAVISFIATALPIPMMPDYPYFGIALTGTLFLFGIIGFIITFYQWLTSYREGRGYRKWERYFE